MAKVDTRLLEYANSTRQKEALKALASKGSERAAAKHMGINHSSLHQLILRVKRNAALRGWSPETDMIHPTSPVHVAKGTSTLYDRDNQPIMQWVKTSLAHDQMIEIMKEVADELKSDLRPFKPIKLVNKTQNSELLNLYPLTDIHFGMRSWAEETGANWDLEIAEQTVLNAFHHLIGHSPNAATGFFLQLGDALHSDGLLPVTPQSGHVLDSDGRFPKVVRTVIRVFRQCVRMLLEKHQKVIVLHAQGNHDPASSVWLQEWFWAMYEEEPRVEVIVSPNPYYAYVHGEVMLGAHHGHKRSKPADLVQVFNDQFRHLLGKTKRTYIHTGHLHSDRESSGTTKVERHETLIAPDAYASHGGFRSDRSMKVITYNHRAEQGRSIFYPEVM